MLKWIDILKRARYGNPPPDRRVERSIHEWEKILDPEVFVITRKKGTEAPFSSELCDLFTPGEYQCSNCKTTLFNNYEKFHSESGWPSFTQPVKENRVAFYPDKSLGTKRIEAQCNTCDAHLGHVFADGPEPSLLRFCINALALIPTENPMKRAYIGGGCFWCTEALFQEVNGVASVESGYSGGKNANPTYREVCSGLSGHAEIVVVTYDPAIISYADILRLHLASHDPTTPDRQGADRGSQYRSIILPFDEAEEKIAHEVVGELQEYFSKPIVTEIKRFEAFYPAEAYHQNYYRDNPEKAYCQAVIDPKLAKFRQNFQDHLKSAVE